jgi:hypothetical protein
MDISEDTKSVAELLRELDDVNLSWEEFHKSARAKGKRVLAWGRMQSTTKRTRVEIRASPERRNKEPKYPSFPSDGEAGYTRRIGGFYEPSLCLNRWY